MKEFFARLNPTERRFVVGVGVVFFLVVNMVWVWPYFGDWGKTREALDTARGLLAKFAGGTNETPKLEREIANYSGQGKFVPLEDQISQFSRVIWNQAAASHVGIINQGTSRQAATDNPFFVEQNQTITVLAGEKELVDFLYHLGADPKSLIRVKVMSVNPDPPHQQLIARVTLVASYQRKAPAAAAPAAATPKPSTPARPAAVPPKPAAPNPAAPKPGQPPPRPSPAGLPMSPLGRPMLPAHPNPLTPNKK